MKQAKSPLARDRRMRRIIRDILPKACAEWLVRHIFDELKRELANVDA